MDLADRVRAARGGDLDAFTALVRQYEDVARAIAVARVGDAVVAEEVAQEAFLDAWRLLPTLREPRAFGAWLRRIAAKQADRVTRRKRREVAAFDPERATAPGPGPEGTAARTQVRDSVRLALAALPERQREVLSLYYLSARSLAEIADIMEIEVGTAKKRLHDARKRMRQDLEDAMRDMFQRPLGTELPTSIKAFLAARTGQADVLAELLERRPELLEAREVADPDLVPRAYAPGGGETTLLHHAVIHGQLDAVRLLLDRGADLEAPTRGGETALHIAVLLGHHDVAELLVARGARVDAALWHGGTAVHVARRRGDRRAEALLVAAGADLDRPNRFGRSARDWTVVTPRGTPGAHGGRVLDARGRSLDGRGPVAELPEPLPAPVRPELRETGIKAVDLLAPLRRGGLHRLYAGPGVGKVVLIGELGWSCGGVVVAGFHDRVWEVRDFEHVLREFGLFAHSTVLMGSDSSDADALVRTATGIAGRGLVVADDRLVDAFRRQRSAATVVAFAPHAHPELPVQPGAVDGTLVLDPELAARRLYPAVDPVHSRALWRPDDALVAEARAALLAWRRGASGGAGERVERFLTQPFTGAEPFNGRPGAWVSLADARADVRAVLDGAADELAPTALSFVGRLSDAGSWGTDALL